MREHNRIIEEMHETMSGLHAGGLIDERRMREFEAMYQAYKVPQYTGETVKELRSRLNVSQAALTIIINTSASTVRAWEVGPKKARWAFLQTAGVTGQEGDLRRCCET